MSDHSSDATPIFLHPRKRAELFGRGQDLFNDQQFFQAHEAWEQLWLVENGRDKNFIQALIQVAGHFIHLEKKNYSGAQSLAQLALAKFNTPPAQPLYQNLDTHPLSSALDYNLNLIQQLNQQPHLTIDSFLIPKLF